ncbi:hypothetical protein ACFQU7_23340 [Pseudoroseomonas wenyumeiae]
MAATRAAAARFGLQGPAVTTLVATVPPQHMYGFETTMAMPLHAATASHAGPHFYPVEVAEALHAAPAPRVLITTPLQMRALLGSGEPLPELAGSSPPPRPWPRNWPPPARWPGIPACWKFTAPPRSAPLPAAAPQPGRSGACTTASSCGGKESDTVWVEVPGMPAPVQLADAVEFQPERRFRLLGRRADMVKLGGKRASLASLNRLLMQVEGVEDGVFVAPDDLDSNPAARLMVYAVAPGRDPAAILAGLRERMEAVFLPRRVLLVPSLPRNAIGKLTRQALEDLRRQPVAGGG